MEGAERMGEVRGGKFSNRNDYGLAESKQDFMAPWKQNRLYNHWKVRMTVYHVHATTGRKMSKFSELQEAEISCTFMMIM